MTAITKFETVVYEQKKPIYIGAYADEKTAKRVRDNIEDFLKTGNEHKMYTKGEK